MYKNIRTKKIKYSIIILYAVFAVSVLYYSCTALQMSAIVFWPGDETRFLALAKSLHYYGHLQENFRLVKYDDILYPLILACAYFFYTPEHILDIFRIIGVILMCSACFPAYFLAKKMQVGNVGKLNGEFFFAILSVIIPEMTYTAYLLEEVLLYPLTLWLFYFVYVEFSAEEIMCKINIKLIFLLFAVYITKTYGIVFAVSYCIIKFLYGIMKNKKKIVISAMLSGVSFLGLVSVLKLILYVMNGMQEGYSHYEDQVLSIFPFTFQVVIGIVRGLVFYSGYFILFSGVVPFLVLCSRIRKMESKDTLWGLYLLMVILLAILEVVVVIHFSENGKDIVLSRFHYRYFFYFFLPLMLIFIKYKSAIKNTIVNTILSFEMIIVLLFFRQVNETGQGIIDGIMCFLLKRANQYAGFSDVCCVILLLLLFSILLLINNEQTLKLYHFSVRFIIAATVISIPLARVIPIRNSENDYFEDYIKIAHYVNSSEANILCVGTNRGLADPVLRHGAYTVKDFNTIILDENTNEFIVTEDNTIILLMKDYLYGLEGNLTPIDIDTKKINLYLVDKGLVSVNKNICNITFYEYGFLENGYDEDGIRYLSKNGISYGPYISLSAGEYLVEITGANLLKADYLCYCGDENYLLTEILNTDSKVIFRFTLSTDVNNFEFSVRNTQEEEIALKKIVISNIIP